MTSEATQAEIQSILEATRIARAALNGPAMARLREVSKELVQAREQLNEVLIKAEAALLQRYPDRQASRVLEPGTKLIFNDQGLSLEVYEKGRYDVYPLRSASLERRMRAVGELRAMFEDF